MSLCVILFCIPVQERQYVTRGLWCVWLLCFASTRKTARTCEKELLYTTSRRAQKKQRVYMEIVFNCMNVLCQLYSKIMKEIFRKSFWSFDEILFLKEKSKSKYKWRWRQQLAYFGCIWKTQRRERTLEILRTIRRQ